MFCFKCGQNFDSPSAVCPRCNTPSATANRSATAPLSGAQPASAGPQTDGKAVASLVLGILSITCFWILAGIPAIILGHMSRSNIRNSAGRLKGDGQATAGLIMGYAGIPIGIVPFLIIAAIAIPNILVSRLKANDSAAAATVRTLVTAQTTYSTKYPAQGYAHNLAALGPGPSGECPPSGATASNACIIDGTLGCTAVTWCEKDAFRYSMVGLDSPLPDFVITARPFPGQGTRSFCATGDGVVRYGKAGRETPVTLLEVQSWEPLRHAR